jgi:hypothetical protein
MKVNMLAQVSTGLRGRWIRWCSSRWFGFVRIDDVDSEVVAILLTGETLVGKSKSSAK